MFRPLLALAALLAFLGPVAAETAIVKYRGPVPLDSFKCDDVVRSSFIKRVCYDAPRAYMVIRLKDTYYQYCGIDRETVGLLLGTPEMGRFYNAKIKSHGSKSGIFSCRIHPVPAY